MRLGWFLLVVAAAGVGGWLLTRETRWLHYTFVAVIVVAAFAFGGRGGPPGERAT